MAIYIWSVQNSSRKEVFADYLASRFETTVKVETGESSINLRFGNNYVNLKQLPGQCGVLVAYGLPEPSKDLVRLVETAALILQYKTVMVSHRSRNYRLDCWMDAGYEPIWENYNIHSNSVITMLARDLGMPSDELCDVTRAISSIPVWNDYE